MSETSPAPSAQKPKLTLEVWKKLGVMLALGFSSGLPYLLIFDTLSAWLRQAGLSLEVIGFFFLATLSYSLKFIWAPFMDRLSVPFLTDKLGHRRSWMLVTQVLIIFGLWGIAGTHPEKSLVMIAVLATLTGFFAASQDIVMDAWRIEAVEADLQGLMAANYQWGYRIAMILAGVLPLVLSKRIGWNASYGVMALLMVIGIVAVLLAPREAAHRLRPIHFEDMKSNPAAEAIEWAARLGIFILAIVFLGSGLTSNFGMLKALLHGLGANDAGLAPIEAFWKAKTTGIFLQLPSVLLGFALLICACLPLWFPTRPGAYFKATFIDPMVDFFDRYHDWAGFILALICVYRISEFVLNIMNPFYLDLGFDVDTIAEMRKVFGVIMSMFGLAVAGWVIAQFGIMRALVLGAIVGPLSHVGFMYLATKGHDVFAFGLAIALDNISASISGTVLIAYMSSLTDKGYTATQYALFSSIYSIWGKLVASQSGRIVEGTAKGADQGGIGAMFKGLMTHLPPTSYTEPAAKLGVSPAALGSGYFAFFAYTIVIGLVAIVMSFWLWKRFDPETISASKSSES